jgi:antitoxin (DNA-binding transcriptional repressor) of toxin-antitoxin stability system
MTQFRKQPGEYAHAASRHGESFIVTSQGKPIFKIVPINPDMTIVLSDGTTIGEKPLTFRENLGGEYAL